MILIVSYINPGITKNLVYFFFIAFYNFPTFFTSKQFTHDKNHFSLFPSRNPIFFYVLLAPKPKFAPRRHDFFICK